MSEEAGREGPLSRYAASSAPQPTQASLDRMLERVAKVRVFDGGLNWDRPFGDKVLAEVDDEFSILDLKQALRIVDGSGGHCMCDGEPTLELLGRDGERLAVIGMHHGQAIRWSEWKDDARLAEGMELLTWLVGCGVDGPLDDFLAAAEEGMQDQALWEGWLDAMPSCLRDLSPETWQKV